MKNNNEIVWKDRKRILGLPITFTKYCIKNNRLFVSKGLLSSKEEELLLYRILDFSLERTLFNKIFKVGTITLFTCDETDKKLKLTNIKNPIEVRDMLSNLVEELRVKSRIRGREIVGVSREYDDYTDTDDE